MLRRLLHALQLSGQKTPQVAIRKFQFCKISDTSFFQGNNSSLRDRCEEIIQISVANSGFLIISFTQQARQSGTI
jgi:hypothetical protein